MRLGAVGSCFSAHERGREFTLVSVGHTGAWILHGPIYPVSDGTACRSDARATAPEALTACVGIAVCGSDGTAGACLFVCLLVQIASIKYEIFTLTNVRACDLTGRVPKAC